MFKAESGAGVHSFFPATAQRRGACPPFRFAAGLLPLLLLMLTGPASAEPATSPTTEPIAATQPADGTFHLDMQKSLEYLASDQLEGRGVGTEGLDKAAAYIAATFQKLDLQPLRQCPDYFQPFTMTTSIEADPKTALRCGDQMYELGKDFSPNRMSGEGEFSGAAVFVGYGISSTQYKYDDYAGIDVKGKLAIALRFEPHDDAGQSRFFKDGWSDEATLARKAKVASAHGATALLLVNPPSYHPGDALMPFITFMPGGRSSIPVIQVKQPVAEAWLRQGLHKGLKEAQAGIDQSGVPASAPLEGVQLAGNVTLKKVERAVKNVVALLPGKGPHADEYVIIGAHYDHLGRGGPGSLAPGSHEIHNGADDNASGVSALLELADRFSHAGPGQRSLLFVAFTAEEEGLIGSEHFVSDSPVPLDKVETMFNLDMVGRVRNETIYVGGWGTAADFDALVKHADEGSPLQWKSFGKGGYGPSDHMSFAMKKIPVLFLFSGLHSDYHRPTDKAGKINFDGMEEVVALAERIIGALEAMPREAYVDAADSASAASAMLSGSGGGSRVTLGVVPDYTTVDEAAKGVRISGAVPGSPAAAAGLKEGDVLIQFGSTKIDTLYDLSDALAKAKAGDKVDLRLLRDNKPLELQATLAERKSE